MPDFETRNLRVQLPCGSQTIIQCRLGTCLQFTCGFVSPVTCRFGTCQPWISICPLGTYCRFFSCGVTFYEGPVECPASDPGPLVSHVAVEDLADLREMLEEQLKEIKAAEAEVAKQQRKK
jgi:hypothetical protein